MSEITVVWFFLSSLRAWEPSFVHVPMFADIPLSSKPSPMSGIKGVILSGVRRV